MRNIRKQHLVAGLALGVAAISLATAAPAAAAPDVVADCEANDSDRCYFQPYDVPWDAKGTWDKGAFSFDTSTYTGPQENPNSTQAVNCTTSDAQYMLATAVTKTDTITHTVTATVSGGLEGVFEASLSYALGLSYATAKEDRQGFTETIPPRHVGWITLAPTYERRSGYLWSNYGSRVDGHYAWAVPVTEQGYIGGTYFLKTAPASADQLAQCGGASGLALRRSADLTADKVAPQAPVAAREVKSRIVRVTAPADRR
jgi:hypothetical protein